jgi:GNAT superfamily N-acetyltransferase
VDGLCGIARLRLVTAKAEVRPASDADLATLAAVLGERHFFADRLARQQRGGGVLLVAWLDGRPVGDVYLDCEPAEEPEVRRLGHERIALGVGLDNPKARRLYARLGYADWGHGTVVGTWVEHPDDGPPVTRSEVCDMLVKRL